MMTGKRVRQGGWLVLVAAAAVLVASASADAAIRYAEPNGNGASGAGQCLLADPCSLQTAVEDPSVVNGDEVIVLTGTYENQADSVLVEDAITVHGEAEQPRPVIPTTDGYAGIRVNSPGAGSTLSHLQVNSTSTGFGVVLLAAATAERLVVQSTGGGHACGLNFGAVIRDSICWTTTNGTDAVSYSASGNVTDSVTLRNVTAIAEGNSSSAVRVEAGNGADLTLDAANVIAVGGLPANSGADVEAETNSALSTTATLNLDFSNYSTQREFGTGALVTDPGTASNQTLPPQFVDAVTGDFHQTGTSPTVDAGSAAVTLLGSADIDGESRNSGLGPDIGADELIDTDPPETTIDSGPSGPTSDATPTFNFSADEPGSTFECSVDTGTANFTACSGVGTHTHSVLADGPYTFRVRATDPSTNVDPTPATRSFSVFSVGTVDTTLDPPVLAKKVNVKPVKGRVTTKCRGEKKFTRLKVADQIPVGCLVDTRKGTVALTSSKGKAGGTQTAKFWSGLFKVTQKAGKRPYTELALAGPTGCRKSKKKRAFGSATRSATVSKKRGGRRLWGKGKGRFKTKGKYGSASVRGTHWLVEDRCNASTLFKVKSGVVKVKDFVRNKSVKLKKGGRYVAGTRRG